MCSLKFRGHTKGYWIPVQEVLHESLCMELPLLTAECRNKSASEKNGLYLQFDREKKFPEGQMGTYEEGTVLRERLPNSVSRRNKITQERGGFLQT
jgi:hypothetical protein